MEKLIAFVCASLAAPCVAGSERTVGGRAADTIRGLALGSPAGPGGRRAPGAFARPGELRLFVDAERELAREFGLALEVVPREEISRAIVRMAESLVPSGAIDLPRSVPCGRLDLRRMADGVQVTGGYGGTVVLGGAQRGIQLLFCELDQVIARGVPRPARASAPAGAGAALKPLDVIIFDESAPASDLLAMFCSGAIRIDHDVRNCSWIAGDNAFGRRTVTANARVDESLFLWFGINWPFADHNAHWRPENRDRDWLENAQMWFDCKGGGRGTRVYLMIETNYGNPGPGVVLRNCDGMALYHGSTERASSRGPGVYWLKDCRDVRLGLRGINAYMMPGHPRSPDPSHDITIEGGRGNVLHGVRAWGFASGETIVNSDPELQLWMAGFQYETTGLDLPGVLRFAVTPMVERPTDEEVARLRPGAREKARKILEARKLPTADADLDRVEREILSGRHAEHRLNARAEETFVYRGVDLTRPGAALPRGWRLPPPPSIPPTDAPRQRREVAFTQAEGFGRALLDAGADPTGRAPSDDAFAKVMFGMTRDEVQALLERSYAADAAFRRARDAKDDAAMKAATAEIDAAMARLHPFEDVGGGGKPRRVRRPRLEIPAGTFLLRRPLVLIGGNAQVWGAGPGRTVLRTDRPIKVIEHHEHGTLANLAVEGGRVGVAVTGADHHDPVSPTLQSYIAGSNYYRLTFRGQSFAAMHIGNDDPGVMGGAEHDQNRYVDIECVDTGDYGIFVNTNMLDKWLCLHGRFRGQRRAGIAIKYSNVLHGAVIGCEFRDIDGPGIDLLGGNATIAYRPWLAMVDQCSFIECGSADSPAVDQGYGELMSFTGCRITTRGKTIACGYAGSAQVYEGVEVDVKVPEGEPVMRLRAARNVLTARANGHALSRVRANGPVAFVNDSNSRDETFRRTLERYGKAPPAGEPVRIEWDANPAAHELAPANGWVHPFVLHDCTFGGKRYEYSLLNVDPDAGKVLEEVDLSALGR